MFYYESDCVPTLINPNVRLSILLLDGLFSFHVKCLLLCLLLLALKFFLYSLYERLQKYSKIVLSEIAEMSFNEITKEIEIGIKHQVLVIV